MNILKKLFRGSKNEVDVYANFMGRWHHLFTKRFKGNEISLEIPFKNNLYGDLPDNIKGPKITINNIRSEKPFNVIEIKPALPITLEYNDNVVFNIKLKSEIEKYVGPLRLYFDLANKNIHISINKIIIIANGIEKDINEIFSIDTLGNSPFYRDIQLGAIFENGFEVKEIKISEPFSLIKTEPELPIKIGEVNTLRLNIKAPEENYAGELILFINP